MTEWATGSGHQVSQVACEVGSGMNGSRPKLRRMPHEEAMADLKRLPGIGDFSAGLTLLRGAGDPDAVAHQEPRIGRAVALAYGLPAPATPEQVLQISENWRPYRTWVTLLLRTQLEDETGEITGARRDALSWAQHVVASRVPPAVRQATTTIRTAGAGPSDAATRAPRQACTRRAPSASEYALAGHPGNT